MKTKNLLLILLVPLQLFSQQKTEKFAILDQKFTTETQIFPKESEFASVKFEKTECVSAEQRLQMNYQIKVSRTLILEKDPKAFQNLQKLTLFLNPFRPKAGFSDYGYHTLQNQVDQDLIPNGHLLDYNCGDRTYDSTFGNHAGTDYILWPYPWKRMQEGTMEVIAAAPGIIVNKKNTNPDLNCLNNGNPAWNGITIEHSDGSTATYMHFKKNTATTKEIGDAVAAGEFLGIAGSSGSSNIPHLHFEIQDVNGNFIDPYQGTCNSLNTVTWWQQQENYYVPKINRISTHYTTTNDSACPVIENTYEKSNFNTGDLFVLKLYYRDIKTGDVTHIKITNPNGVVISEYDWAQDWGLFYPTAFAYWTFDVTNSWLTGIYNVEVTFGGSTYTTIFGVRTALASSDETQESLSIYPNPVNDILYLKNSQSINAVEILDMTGRLVKKVALRSSSIDVSKLSKGTYILKIQNTEQKTETLKFIKK